MSALLASRASANRLKPADRPTRRKALEASVNEDDDLLSMIADIRREREALAKASQEQEANASQATKDMWAAEEAERQAERQRIEDEKREKAELAAL